MGIASAPWLCQYVLDYLGSRLIIEEGNHRACIQDVVHGANLSAFCSSFALSAWRSRCSSSLARTCPVCLNLPRIILTRATSSGSRSCPTGGSFAALACCPGIRPSLLRSASNRASWDPASSGLLSTPCTMAFRQCVKSLNSCSKSALPGASSTSVGVFAVSRSWQRRIRASNTVPTRSASSE